MPGAPKVGLPRWTITDLSRSFSVAENVTYGITKRTFDLIAAAGNGSLVSDVSFLVRKRMTLPGSGFVTF
jgi:hypothetical protein